MTQYTLSKVENPNTISLHSTYANKKTLKCCYKRFDFFIISRGYNKLSLDHYTYYNRFDENYFITLLFHTDDMWVVSSNKA